LSPQFILGIPVNNIVVATELTRMHRLSAWKQFTGLSNGVNALIRSIAGTVPDPLLALFAFVVEAKSVRLDGRCFATMKRALGKAARF
jgi:hypothetical protein